MTLEASEFIRRFLLHVLPRGFQRIRYFGWLGNRHRASNSALCRRLLDCRVEISSARERPAGWRELYQELSGRSLESCPACRRGRMVLVEYLPVGLTDKPPP